MKRAPMTKGQAIREIAIVCRAERPPTKGEFRRLIRAFETLGLTPGEMLDACRYLNVVRPDGTIQYEGLEQLAPWYVSV
jgi:hypothetical protein